MATRSPNTTLSAIPRVSDDVEDPGGAQPGDTQFLGDTPDPNALTAEEFEALADPNNAANPAAVRAKKKQSAAQVKLDRERNVRIQRVLGAMLDYAEGREFLCWLLLDVLGLFRKSTFVDMDKDRMLFLEGSRTAAVDLHQMLLRSDANQYMDMLAKKLGQM
jgi:hypothetical protein